MPGWSILAPSFIAADSLSMVWWRSEYPAADDREDSDCDAARNRAI
jgi:hypothetical protein